MQFVLYRVQRHCQQKMAQNQITLPEEQVKVPLMLCVVLLHPIIVLPEQIPHAAIYGLCYHVGLWQDLVPMPLLLFCSPLYVSSCLWCVCGERGCMQARISLPPRTLESEVFLSSMSQRSIKMCVSGLSCGLEVTTSGVLTFSLLGLSCSRLLLGICFAVLIWSLIIQGGYYSLRNA